MFGYTCDDAIGVNVKILMPEPFGSEHDLYLSRYLLTGQQHIIGVGRLVKGLKKNGMCFSVQLKVAKMVVGEDSFFVGVLQDVSQAEKDKNTIAGEREKFVQLVESATDAIILIDPSGVIETVNGAMLVMFQYEREQVIGQNISMLMAEPHCSNCTENITQYLRSPEPHVMGLGGRQFPAKRRDGSVFHMELIISEVNKGGMHVFNGIIRDMEKLEEGKETLKAAMAKINSLLSMTRMFLEFGDENRGAFLSYIDREFNVSVDRASFKKSLTGLIDILPADSFVSLETVMHNLTFSP